MQETTENDIRMAMLAHACDRETAINSGFAASVARSRQEFSAEREKNLYVMQRSSEYPPMADYLDGIVKGDQAQVQAYIDACLAVKAKYPKPSEAA